MRMHLGEEGVGRLDWLIVRGCGLLDVVVVCLHIGAGRVSTRWLVLIELVKILKCELLRCIYCVHQPFRQAIWGAEYLEPS